MKKVNLFAKKLFSKIPLKWRALALVVIGIIATILYFTGFEVIADKVFDFLGILI